MLFALLVLAVSLALIYGGFKLVALGGSRYYLIAGVAYLLLAVLFLMRARVGIALSIAIFLATCIWALYEVGQLSYWELLPRLVVPAIILTLSLWVGAALPSVSLSTRRAARQSLQALSTPDHNPRSRGLFLPAAAKLTARSVASTGPVTGLTLLRCQQSLFQGYRLVHRCPSLAGDHAVGAR